MYDLNVPADVRRSLAEDVQSGDITASLLPPDQKISATVVTRESAVICGIPWFNEIFKQIDANVDVHWLVAEGDHVEINQTLVRLQGNARSIITGERAALNWLQTLSGTATITARYVASLQGLNTALLDTRKTIPGLRQAQKYAVKIGGGSNHRMGLFDAFLIKENHIASCGSITKAIKSARQLHPDKKCEIEVENLSEFQEALAAQPDVIMLDNFSLEDMQVAVGLNQGHCQLEVSGNVEVEQLSKIAATGVDFISVGALTKHIRAIDLSLRFE